MHLALSSVVAALLLATAESAFAAAAPVASAPTRIPAEPLDLALRTLARQRGFQVVFDSEQIGQQRTRGASGDLTADQALTQVLRGTGLTFQRMTDGGVVIEPIASQRGTPVPPRAALAAQSAARPTGAGSPETAPPLDAVTIQAIRKRQALRRRVDHFVASVAARPADEALYRWNTPVCPLVAGLTKPAGEFILGRISQAAAEARAPLAGKVCRPNLYVVATASPDLLIKRWWARDARLFNVFYGHTRGIAPVGQFIHSTRPIRAWYNTGLSCSAGIPFGRGVPPAVPDLPICIGAVDTPLVHASTWSNITSAIVVVDLRRVKHVTIEQLADYIALVGLADVRPEADPSPETSILQLFGDREPPRGLSLWDRALLYSLYNTSQWSGLQVPRMEAAMVDRIAR